MTNGMTPGTMLAMELVWLLVVVLILSTRLSLDLVEASYFSSVNPTFSVT
jgi:hypothetical protein